MTTFSGAFMLVAVIVFGPLIPEDQTLYQLLAGAMAGLGLFIVTFGMFGSYDDR